MGCKSNNNKKKKAAQIVLACWTTLGARDLTRKRLLLCIPIVKPISDYNWHTTMGWCQQVQRRNNKTMSQSNACRSISRYGKNGIMHRHCENDIGAGWNYPVRSQNIQEDWWFAPIQLPHNSPTRHKTPDGSNDWSHSTYY